MQNLLFSLSAFSLILVGIFGVLTRKNILKVLLALNILETGVNLLVVSLGYFKDGKTPILSSGIAGDEALHFVDPLPHALVLISILIGLGTTALALTLTIKYFRTRKTLRLVDIKDTE